MSRVVAKKKNKQPRGEKSQKVFVGSSIVHLSGFSLCGKKGELDLTSLNSKQIRKKIGWL